MTKNVLIILLVTIGLCGAGLLLYDPGEDGPARPVDETPDPALSGRADPRRLSPEQRLQTFEAFVEEVEAAAAREPAYFGNARMNDHFEPAGADVSEPDGEESSSDRQAQAGSVTLTLRGADLSRGYDDEESAPMEVGEQAKALLGIDTEELFGVDMESERREIRSEMGRKVDARLEEALRHQGMSQEDLQNYMRVRQALKTRSVQQSPGVQQYEITVDDNDS
jgi:hypothetical protein